MFLCGSFDQKVYMTERFNTFLATQVNLFNIRDSWTLLCEGCWIVL